MEEAKNVPEPVSGIEYYQIIRAQIEHEDNLINQRLSWFVAAQSFLFTAYAILLNAPPAPMRVEKFVTQQDILFPLIPVVAIGMSLLIYTTIFAAMRAMANLRRLLESHLNERERAVLPPVQGYRLTLLLGQAAPILIPFVFMLSWIVLLIKSLTA